MTNALALATLATFRNRITQVDALTLCASLPEASVDCILTDPPYGTTACSWDVVVPFEPMWAAFKRVLKPRGAVVMTASQPFSSLLVCSNLDWFRYEWIWEKEQGSNFLDAWVKPYKVHESVLVFAPAPPNYFPIFTPGEPYVTGERRGTSVYGAFRNKKSYNDHGRLPRSIQSFQRERGQHPTQKPVALFEYLIKTYTHPGALILDPFCGSGTAAVAAKITGRDFICGDTSAEYCELARRRVFPEFGKPAKRIREPEDLTKSKVLANGDKQLSLFAGVNA